jgi:hypothetical protein
MEQSEALSTVVPGESVRILSATRRAPVSVNGCSPPRWVQAKLFMNGVLLLAYSGYMASVFRPSLKPLWLWDGWKMPIDSDRRSQPLASSMQSGHHGNA